VAMIVPLIVLSTKRVNNIPTSRLGQLIEILVVFIRDELAIPNIGKKQANTWLPYLCTVFVFLYVINILGLVPGMAGASANISFTAAMALSVFIIFNVVGMIHNGPVKYFTNLVPSGIGIVFWVVLFPIELVGLLTKSLALAIRLFANMAAGHFIIISLMGLITIMGSYIIAPAFIGLTLFIYVLKLLVVFLQAYVFTLLASLFIGSAIHQDH
jgi:F-type H+-transporting ATPase subunit a